MKDFIQQKIAPIFNPMLFTDLKQYNKGKFFADLIAGIIVAIIALPLSIALAIASGVSPEAGIYTAIVAGLLTAIFGGSSVQITGPTAAFATIVAGVVAKNGMDGLALATVMAGIFLVIMGALKMGNLIRFIPYSITTGFTAGIAVTLVIGQLKDFCGVTYLHGHAPIETLEKLQAFIGGISTFNIQALLVGIVALAILFLFPRIKGMDKIPASLIAVIVGTVMVLAFRMKVNTIGDLYKVSSNPPSFHMPNLSIKNLSAVIPDAITIAILAGIESLLSCVVSDGMIGKHHRSNTELIAQGIANVGSALFGGIPATGAIARTAANIKNGGKTPVTGIVHSVILFLVLIVLMPYASYIPMPVIAAILINVAYNMCGWKNVKSMIQNAPKSDNIVLLLTFFLTVIFDLVVAIEIGVVAACILFMKRMSEETHIISWKYVKEDSDEQKEKLMQVPEYISVFELNGPLFFAVSNQIQMIKPKSFTKCIILRMRAVPSIDADAIRQLRTLVINCKKKDVAIVFSHVNEQPLNAMKKSGLYELCGEENFCENIDSAMDRAREIEH